MTLPASGTITLQQIQDEYLAPRGTGLTSLYRGGAYVANTAANAGVPTSGAIGLTNFYGGQRTGPLSINASDLSGDSWPGSGINFGSSTGNASGGTPPYTYAWTFVSGSTFTLTAATSASTGFVRTGNPPQGTAAAGVYKVTVTDSVSATASKNINVSDSRA